MHLSTWPALRRPTETIQYTRNPDIEDTHIICCIRLSSAYNIMANLRTAAQQIFLIPLD